MPVLVLVVSLGLALSLVLDLGLGLGIVLLALRGRIVDECHGQGIPFLLEAALGGGRLRGEMNLTPFVVLSMANVSARGVREAGSLLLPPFTILQPRTRKTGRKASL